MTSSSGRRRVAIIGSTGSIGTQALDVAARHPDRFEIVALAAGRNVGLLAEQIARFDVPLASLADPGVAAGLAASSGRDVRSGTAGLLATAVESRPDVVLAASDGAVAFEAVFCAVERGIDVAVANKELVVAAGELLLSRAAASGTRIVPVDSEHSAIFQCLVGEDPESVDRLVLTASGGPFRTTPAELLPTVRPEDALKHPTWSMGVKNSVDSATLMNKGLEVIEASRLFGVPAERIDVLVHPTSFAHAFVRFRDGSIKAQLAAPDMRLPIGYALAYPRRLPVLGLENDPLRLAGGAAGVPFAELRFERVDHARFPALGLAYRALREGGTAAAVLSAANEIAVRAFAAEEIAFPEIAATVAHALDTVAPRTLTLPHLALADAEARRVARLRVEALRDAARPPG